MQTTGSGCRNYPSMSKTKCVRQTPENKRRYSSVGVLCAGKSYLSASPPVGPFLCPKVSPESLLRQDEPVCAPAAAAT